MRIYETETFAKEIYVYADTRTDISWLHGFHTALSSIFQHCPLYCILSGIFSSSVVFSNALPRNLATRIGKLTKLPQCLSMIYADTALSFVNRYVAFITNLWAAKKRHTMSNMLQRTANGRIMSAAIGEPNDIYIFTSWLVSE
jgi:hypothetical protein